MGMLIFKMKCHHWASVKDNLKKIERFFFDNKVWINNNYRIYHVLICLKNILQQNMK